MDTSAPRPGQPLNGWKEIAAYLGKSVRSVQRWEVALGLPVHRIRTPDGQIVYAEREEIDEWRRRQDVLPAPEPEDPADPESLPEPVAGSTVPQTPVRPSTLEQPFYLHRWWLAAAAIALFAGGTLFGGWISRASPIAVSLVLAGRSLQGLNQDGAVVWSHQFGQNVRKPTGPNMPSHQLVDLDDDGAQEWLVPVTFAMNGASPATSDALYSFTQDGRFRWSIQPDEKLTYPNRVMSAPWQMTDYAVSTRADRVWAAFRHHAGSSSFVLELSPAGRQTLRYVNFGTIYTVAHWITSAGGFLAVGGVNVEHRRPVLVLMPENDAPATSPADDPRRATCAECPAGRPHRQFFFPESELTEAAASFFPYVSDLQLVGPMLKVVTVQGQGNSQFMLNPDFSVASFVFAESYWGAHKQWELKGRLDHTAEDCPERLKPVVVREWTPASGWRDQMVSPRAGNVVTAAGPRD